MRSLMLAGALVVVGTAAALAQGTAPANEGAGGTPTPGPAQDTPAAQEPAQPGGTPGSAMAGAAGTKMATHGKHAGKAHHHKKHHTSKTM